MSYLNIFEQQYDVAVYGAGYAGLAAAWALGEQGKRVLLFDRRLDVAWESSRSFASHAGESPSPLWQEFVSELQAHNLIEDGIIDSAGAEVVAAKRLRVQRENIRTLLNAWPVEVVVQGDQIQAVTVATKSGLQTVRAQRWIDASEEASLFRLVFPQLSEALRKPQSYEQRALFFHQSGQFPASDLPFEQRRWNTEKALVLRSQTPLDLPALQNKVSEIRSELDAAWQETRVVAFSVLPLPVYGEREGDVLSYRGNLFAASPALDNSSLESLAERFQLGVRAAERVLTVAVDEQTQGEEEVRAWPVRSESCEVFVAGAGTGGALAAMAAHGEGVDVLCADTATFAGGVGSGGLINGYFHGQKGGLFESYDDNAMQTGKAINPGQPANSHENKKIAFAQTVPSQRFLTEALAYAVETQDGRINTVKLVTPAELIEVHTQAVIDATGDGDVAALAGASFDFGRGEDGFPLSYSQPSLMADTARETLVVRSANFDAGWCDPTDPQDLTRARLTAIAQYASIDFSHQYHPILLAPILGLRQSRHFQTEKRLTLGDLAEFNRDSTSIGITRSPLDTHSIDYEFEDDENMFWLWGCKVFRDVIAADMPYGVMVPQGFKNLWLACRAAGMTPGAAYAARMQRDVQRLGEAAGYAAALAVKSQQEAMDVPVAQLQEKLRASGALVELESSLCCHPLELLEEGIPGAYLWKFYSQPKEYETALLEKLDSADSRVSWLAAVALAMNGDKRAEPRLIAAIENNEEGVEPPPSARGPFGQLIDIPNWFLAIVLLRRCGDGTCLPALLKVAQRPGNILNLRTSIALTVARIADRLDAAAREQAAAILNALLGDEVPESYVRPSRSLTRQLRGEDEPWLVQEPLGVDTREEHRWRLDFAVSKAAAALNMQNSASVDEWLNDERALVRAAFEGIR